MAGRLQDHPLIAVVDEITRLRGRLGELFAAIEYAPDLSRLQTLVLASALEAPAAPTVPQIGRSLGHPRQVIQRAANELVERGLLRKAANPDHKRAALLVPTARALELKQASDRAALALAQEVLADFGAERTGELAATLRDFREFLQAREDAPPPETPGGSVSLLQLEGRA